MSFFGHRITVQFFFLSNLHVQFTSLSVGSAPCDWNPSIYGEHCKWSCKKCGAPWWAADGACPDPQCSHHKELSNTTNYGKAFTGKTKGANTVEDYLVIPESIKAGDYVLRWRWDAEASSQIWTTCSDITIV